MFVSKDFQFEASHFLTKYYGKCEKLHGHSYRLRVTVEGQIAPNGLVLDFAILKRIVKRKVVDVLDHSHLNDILENPSAERLCQWIWQQLSPFDHLLNEETTDELSSVYSSVHLQEIQLWETSDSSILYRGP